MSEDAVGPDNAATECFLLRPASYKSCRQSGPPLESSRDRLSIYGGNADLGYIARLALLGLGLYMFLCPNNSTIMGGVPQERLGMPEAIASLRRKNSLAHAIISLLGQFLA